MLEVINKTISAIIQTMGCYHIMEVLLETKNKDNIKQCKTILLLLAISVLFYILASVDTGISKPFIMYIIIVIAFKYIYNIPFNKSAICNLISMILNIFGEAIMGILIVVLKIPNEIIYKYLSNTALSNFLMFVTVMTLLHLTKKHLLKFTKIMSAEKIAYTFCFIVAIAMTLMLSKNIGRWKIDFDFIINMLILVVYAIIVIFLLREKYKTHRKTEEFNEMYEQVEAVKTLLNRYKKHNHENKNQLIVIRENSKGNEKVIQYIDSILEENEGHKDKWISELSYITDIGISGFLSVKINKMLDDNMNVTLTISPKVKKFDFSKLNSREYKDLCRIIGVYLDNAYEASRETLKKEITIEMLIDNDKLLIIISNSFNGVVELDKIDNDGYTTKGKNHGVGLSLVKDVISKNEKLEQKREIIKDYFYQYLYIKK